MMIVRALACTGAIALAAGIAASDISAASEQPGAPPPAKTVLPVEIRPSDRNVPAKNTRLSPPLPPAVQQSPQKLRSGIIGPSATPGQSSGP
jgi:hypothetical protein